MKIIKDFRNDLLKRQEVSFSLEAEKNPGFDWVRKQVSEQVGKPGENIDVYNIKGGFGSHEFKVDAYVYDSKEGLKKFAKKEKKKDIGKKEVKVEEEKVEEKPVEGGAPAEEKPEQVQEKPAEKPSEAPVEERLEEEAKAVKEQKQAEEEAKEP